jgi:GNAT superfamily N-acetyltransferase
VGRVSASKVLITPPEKLTAEHDLTQFCCGEPSLDQWLKMRALQNEKNGASRTYVVCTESSVVGFYALAAGAVAHAEAPTRIKRNMPDPIPVMLLGRLAVDERFQHRGIGTDLLQDAVLRTLQAAGIAGIRAILVNAISKNAKQFYENYGFIASPVDAQMLMITVAEASRALTQRI